eukprot:GILI01036423.1.p1 GENE.GILI01036423.1~~GILI01036423.1.p1  ORF type:complete len:206 (-),score=30.58 GILI01036423.1:71-688(-)
MKRLLHSSGLLAAAASALGNGTRRWAATEAMPSTTEEQVTSPQVSTTEQPKDIIFNQTASPHRKVGNVFIIYCIDHPFKYQWETARMLRELRIEFKGQTVICPDIPQVRLRLWRVRHIVKIDMVDTDELKQMIGVPSHIKFSDLRRQLPVHVGDANKSAGNPYLRSRVDFMLYRRQRMRDIMHRDQQELKLLAEKKKLKAAQQQQ